MSVETFREFSRQSKLEQKRQRERKTQSLLDEICAQLPTDQAESARVTLRTSTDEQLTELLKRIRALTSQ
jgi:hypothetical protein